MNKKGSVRTCVSCGKRKDKHELIRFVAGLNNELLADVQFKLPGRGVSVCFDLKCLKNLTRKNKLSSALRNPEVSTNITEILTILKAGYEKYFYNLLKVGFGGRNVTDGLDKCIEKIKKNIVHLLILSADTGKDSLKKIENFIELYNVRTIIMGTKQYLSEVLDKPLRSVYCITDELFANKLYAIYDKISSLKDWMEQEVPCNG